jgi:hypothetical protein
MAGKLEKHGVLTLAELVRRGDEIGQLCGLKLGPKMKLEKLLQRLTARGTKATDSVEEMPPQSVLPPMQAAPEAPLELLSAELQAVMI